MAPSEILQAWFPGTTSPFICNAPMFPFAKSQLAAAVTKAGGFGYINAGFDFSASSPQLAALTTELTTTRALLGLPAHAPLSIGVGFISTICNPAELIANAIPILTAHRVAAAWLFAPPDRACHTAIVPALKKAGLKVFVQVGSVQTAREAVEDGADVVVVQGTDAGGHQWAQGASLVSLLPEVVDMLSDEFQGSKVQILGAGGVVDGRGIAAALVLGASGAVMGSRFIVTEECPAPDYVKSAMLAAKDGGQSTTKSSAFDDIQGTAIWPEVYDGRAIIGDSYRDHLSGLETSENLAKHHAAQKSGDTSRKIVWAGSGVGMIKTVLTAEEVVKSSQEQARKVIEKLQKL